MSSPELQHAVVRTLSELGGPRDLASPEASPLEMLIGLLTGDPENTEADGGIAGCSSARLGMLERAATRESEDCLERLRCLLELMDAGTVVGSLPLSREASQRLCHHLLRALDDHARWQSLATNAAYYRDHPDVAAQVAQAWERAREDGGD